VAWTHTVSTSRRFTFYQLSLVPGDRTSYYVDGQPLKMGTRNVVVDTGHGTARHTFHTTRWGTVADVAQAGYHWTTTAAYAVDDSWGLGDFRPGNQYLGMGQST